MAKERTFTRGTFDPVTGESSKVINAAATQVRADFEKDLLAKKHSSGKMDDETYIKSLQGLAQEYRKGTGLRNEVQAERIGAAQVVAGNYQGEREQAQVQFADEALANFNQATSDYASGLITTQEYTQKKEAYNEAIRGTAPIANEQKLTKQVLGGKFWDQYASGRVRNMMREKQIRGIYKEVTGQKPEKSTVRAAASGEGTLGYIREQVKAEQGLIRDLDKEKAALEQLVKVLGRLPTADEIKKQAYG